MIQDKASLHEAKPRKGRTAPNRTSKCNRKNTKQLKGIFLGDTVSVFGRGYVSGFTGTSGFYVKTIDGEYIKKPDKAYKHVGYKDITFFLIITIGKYADSSPAKLKIWNGTSRLKVKSLKRRKL